MTTTTRAQGLPTAPSAGGRAASRPGRRPARLVPALGATLLLLLRGLRRDALLLGAWGAVVVIAVAVAVGGPRVTADVLDTGAREAVRDAGTDADVVVSLRTTRPAAVLEYRDGGVDQIGLPTLRGVLGEPVATAAATRLDVWAVGGEPLFEEVVLDELLDSGLEGEALEAAVEAALAEGRDRFPRVSERPEARAVVLEEASSSAVRVVDGELGGTPAAEGAHGVALPEATARAWGLTVGDVLTLAGPATGMTDLMGVRAGTTDVEVTAVVAPTDPDALLWRDAWPVWERPTGREAQVLVTPELATSLLESAGATVHGVVRLVVDPERFSADAAARVVDELGTLAYGLDAIVPRRGAEAFLVDTDLPEVLEGYLGQARAAAAQMSVPTAGAVGVVAVVLLLVARLVVGRRRAVLELERARGAAVGVAVGRLAAESVLVTAVAVAAGLGLLEVLLPGPVPVAPLAAVVVTALVATPLWGALVARRAWSGSREPANRRDRDRLARRRAAARVVGEAAVLALAVGAAAAMRGRGLLQTSTRGVDPFLAAAPLLIAAALTVVALRVYPWGVRALAVLARRSPGVLGVVGAARARRTVAPLPLLALTLAAAVGSTGLLLVGTVRAGQEDASWARVGADAAVDLTSLEDVGTADVVAALADAPGVTAAVGAYVRAELRADLGTRSAPLSLVAAGDGFAALLAQVPGSGADLAALGALDDHTGGAGSPVPGVVDRRLARSVGERGIAVTVERVRVVLEVAGTTDHAPRGLAPGPFLYVPLDGLADADGLPVPATVAWVQGPGAGDAAARVAADVGLPAEAVTTRVDWLAERRSAALVAGVERTLVLGGLAAVALAAVGVVATVLGGSRERGRALALLRTLGMRSGLGWWLVLVELAPVVLTAALAGAGAGAAVVALLGSALGLDVPAGGPDVPPVVVDPAVPVSAAVGAVVLLLVAAAAEVAAHRRDRLSEVVRVGETPGG